MMLTIPSELVTAFKKESAHQIPKIVAYHEAHGNEAAADAIETAAEAVNSL